MALSQQRAMFVKKVIPPLCKDGQNTTLTDVLRARIIQLVLTLDPKPADPPTYRRQSAKILARSLTTHSCRLLDATQRPSKPAQRNDLFSFFPAQDITHSWPQRLTSPLQRLCLKPSSYGRF